jgi:hypothetical protein
MITLFDHAFFDHVSDAALPQPLFNAVSRTYEEHVHKTELRFDANAVWIGQCLNRVCIQAPRASLEVPTITAFEHGVDDHLFRALRRSWPACKPAWSPVTATALRHPDELLPAGPTQGFLAESSTVDTKGSVAVWESCDAKETMAMSMSSLESPLEADPVILMTIGQGVTRRTTGS